MFAYGDNYWFMPPERRNIAIAWDRIDREKYVLSERHLI